MKMVRTVGRAFPFNCTADDKVNNCSRFGGGLLIALIMLPFFAATSVAADRGTRGTLNVIVVNPSRASGPVCLSLRDLTMGLVVGLICDGDDLDLNPKTGRISLDLPRRSFAVGATAPGTSVASVVPNRFSLSKTQLVLVQLSRKDQ